MHGQHDSMTCPLVRGVWGLVFCLVLRCYTHTTTTPGLAPSSLKSLKNYVNRIVDHHEMDPEVTQSYKGLKSVNIQFAKGSCTSLITEEMLRTPAGRGMLEDKVRSIFVVPWLTDHADIFSSCFGRMGKRFYGLGRPNNLPRLRIICCNL